MEALSIITGAITLVGAISTALNQVETLQNAPDDVHALINEVSDIQIVFQEIDTTLRERQERNDLPQSTIESLCTLLQSAKTKLVELDSFLSYRLIHSYKSTAIGKVKVKVNRVAWLRERFKVKKLREELRDAKRRLSDLWITANS